MSSNINSNINANKNANRTDSKLRNKKLFTIPSAPELGVKWEERTREALTLRGNAPKGLEHLLQPRNPSLSWPAYIRLKLLHRQFSGKAIPGLRLAVRTARHTMRRLKQFPLLRNRVPHQ